MTHPAFMMNQTSFTAQRGESACARASFFLLILAGIAAAVSVLFVCAVVLSVRLCVLVGVILVGIVLSVLPLIRSPGAPKERPVR